MNAYEKAQSLGLGGGDAQVVAKLKTLTQTDIPVTDVLAWLREEQLWIQGPGGVMIGALQTVLESTRDDTVKNGLIEFYASTFSNQAVNIRLTRLDIAVRFAQVLALIKAVIPNGEEVEAKLYDMAGGLLYPDLTVEQFAQQRADAEVESTRDALIKATLAPIEEAAAAAAARKNNAEASLGLEHIAGLTLEELTERCEAVAASVDGLVGE